jgi:hypothetical protein
VSLPVFPANTMLRTGTSLLGFFAILPHMKNFERTGGQTAYAFSLVLKSRTYKSCGLVEM